MRLWSARRGEGAGLTPRIFLSGSSYFSPSTSQSVGRSVRQSASQSVSQLASHSVSQSVKHSHSHSVSQKVKQSVSQTANQSASQSVIQPTFINVSTTSLNTQDKFCWLVTQSVLLVVDSRKECVTI